MAVPTAEQANFEILVKTARKNWSGDAITNNRKKPERGKCSNKLEDNITPRFGLLDVNAGDAIDREFLDNKWKVLWAFGLKWPWHQVPKKLVDGCPAEPWAGHYSGSILELLFLLDVFTEESYDQIRIYANANENTPKSSELNTEPRRLKAALASAFLIGFGYHSAIEVYPFVAAYLGTFNIRGKCSAAIDGVITATACEVGNTCKFTINSNVYSPTADFRGLMSDLKWNL